MPLPLLGGGREGVFHASLTKPHSLFTLAIAKRLRAPPLKEEGINILREPFTRELTYFEKFLFSKNKFNLSLG
ncbi:hypothetical protein CGT74_09825 [Vibrio cholerae]|nr:hypothetical protein CGT78_14640 [Vibrio cholerae]PAS22056.1 hypothetical protein CGT74_09825 [Vibrio cholerae]